MRLRHVTFARWLQGHSGKPPQEKWLRELYPWPVFARIDLESENVGKVQRIVDDGVEYCATLIMVQVQERGTIRYRILLESEGIGWHGRAWQDEFEVIGSPEGEFITLFARKKEEELERIARAFFRKKWSELERRRSFKSLAVSRYLAACLTSNVVEEVFKEEQLEHYPVPLLNGGARPMFARGRELWIGYRFLSEDAYAWARRIAADAKQVIALYFVDTKYQFRTDLPDGCSVTSLVDLDVTYLSGRYEDYIWCLMRGLETPSETRTIADANDIVTGRIPCPSMTVSESDVNEALAALRRPCVSKSELRYQLAAGVVLNAWIESERKLGFRQRKKFYAFKSRISELATWALNTAVPGVFLWREAAIKHDGEILFFRIDGVDFSFHAIPLHDTWERTAVDGERVEFVWCGVKLKPIAPIVLAWARALLAVAPA